MRISKSSVAKCLFSAAMLSGLGVMAQTATAPTPAIQTAPQQDFATDLAKASPTRPAASWPTLSKAFRTNAPVAWVGGRLPTPWA